MTRRRFGRRLVALLGIGAGVLTMPALAQDCPELVAQLPGPIDVVAVSGGHAYIGSGSLWQFPHNRSAEEINHTWWKES